MFDRQRFTTYGITTTAAAAILLGVWLKPWKTQDITSTDEPATVSDGPQVDVVFAVDTTSSMGSLLDNAKQTVWSIATHIRKLEPDADLRIGMVAYRDIGDDYVTKDLALTHNLDSVYAELSSYRAVGGGDIPEDVDAALDDAVHAMHWRSGAKKLVFLVGDAPPATRGDVPAFDDTSRIAGEQGIVINTIRCGHDPDTAEAWTKIASLAHGQFSTIEPNGAGQTIATPYDAKMAELSSRIDQTTMIYGDAVVHARYEAKMGAAAAAAPAAKADRGAYYAVTEGGPKGGGMAGNWTSARDPGDVLQKINDGTLDLATLDHDKLPAGVGNLSNVEIKAEVARRASERAAAQKELGELAVKRDEYLHAQATSGTDGFDHAVEATVDAELK